MTETTSVKLSWLAPEWHAANWPAAGNPARVEVARARWLEAGAAAGISEFAETLADAPEGARLLAAIGGNSPFLTDCLVGDPIQFRALLAQGPDLTFSELMAGINGGIAADADETRVMRVLRQAKRKMALAVALADIGGLWPLAKVTQALSRFAGAALDVAADHLLLAALRARRQPADAATLPDLRRGLVILGMGKLGAGELNYSSDIDLILLYDVERVSPAVQAAIGDRSISDFYVRLARGLLRLMAERTADGYVFRTDLRLRPDPGSTPLAISVRGAEAYYESVGQNWERAAMIKARPVAGDIAAGDAFLSDLRPFLWRKHLDFAALADIHSIKRQIHAARGGGQIAVAGHNVKLGRGGIREIEFFAQTQQLIWGGRNPALRTRGTLESLDGLVAAGLVPAATAADLTIAYEFLRQVEHRLQMIDDQQTHKLPTETEALEQVARFLGFADLAAFAAMLTRHLGLVQNHYAGLFEEAPDLSGPASLSFTGKEDDPDTLETLAGMGFQDPAAVSSGIRGWHHGRIRATRSPRARELLTELTPALLTELAATDEPDAAFTLFDRFLGNLPAGVQMLSLLHARPAVLKLVSAIMGTAPSLADLLARQPNLLDGVLSDRLATGLPGAGMLRADLAATLAAARDYQDQLDLARNWVNDRRFQIGALLLDGRADMLQSAAVLTDIADAVIDHLLAASLANFEAQHGHVPNGAFAVVGMGRLGAREMTPTSDLDLVFIYDAADPTDPSDGARPLPASVYYTRLGQRLISALTALTGAGALYQVDMRLRPSGNKGPVSVMLEGFERYFAEEAWTWEFMALTRARLVASSEAGFADRVRHAIAAAVTRRRDAGALWSDVASMRMRIQREHGGGEGFDLKHRAGGLLDLDFLLQGLVLQHAADHPGLVQRGTLAVIDALTDGKLLPALTAADLAAAAKLFQIVQGLLRLTTGGKLDPAHAPAGLKSVLARAAGAVDFIALERNITAVAAQVAAHYQAMIAERATPALDAAAQPLPSTGDTP